MSRYESAGYQDLEPDDSGMRLCEQQHAALKLMKAVAKVLKESKLPFKDQDDLAFALKYARIWFNVAESEINEH